MPAPIWPASSTTPALARTPTARPGATWPESERFPEQATGSIFDLYAKASAYHRMLVREGYERMMDLAHPRHDVHQPLAIAELPPVARLLYLAIAIDATDGPQSYDRLDLDQSDHRLGRYIYRSNRKVPDIDHWRDKLPAIEAYLGGRWRVERGVGSNIVLTRLPDIAPAFPLEPTMLEPGHAYLGQDLNTGKPVHVAFDQLSHTLVAGPTGMGKSVMLHTLMASVVTNLDRFETVHLVDLKYGLELQDYATLSSKFRLTATPAEIGPLLAELVTEMDRRGRLMREARKQNWDGPLILIIIDEFADVLLSESDKKKRDALETALVRLTNLSRALGFRFWLQSQKTTADALPTPIRTNLQSILSFRMSTNQSAAGLFGSIEGLPANIMLLNPGQAIYRDGRTSETVALQGPLVTFDDVARLLPAPEEKSA
ncbi:MAG: FtsK/SpoIIIE domain-containing protein [Hyphomicrobiaceae bacterium]